MLDARTVVVSHSPPFGILDSGFGDVRIGSCSLGAFLAAHPCDTRSLEPRRSDRRPDDDD